MTIGRFIAGIAAVIQAAESGQYLLLRRAADNDYGAGAWECITGRVDQGESFEEALHREVQEELGVRVRPVYILGTTHFYRGTPIPENELVGVVYLCVLDNPGSLRLSSEHSEYRWLVASQVFDLLIAMDPITQWARRVIERAELVRPLLPASLLELQGDAGFEFG
jgi:8-oxo-dGTP diphosphatase